MNEAELEELEELVYTNNWYINTRWNDPSQKDHATLVAAKIVALVTGQGVEPGEPTDPDDPDPVDPDPYSPPEWMYDTSYFPVVGHRFSQTEFLAYLESSDLEEMQWDPTGITMHHTASPDLAIRPNGFEERHMGYLRDYYKDDLGWSRGPHIFTVDNGIWVFCALTMRGIHAVSFNSSRFGIEMLGDFSYNDDPNSGRGKRSTDMGKFAAAAIMKVLGISTGKLNFHRHDPETTKDCPGRKIEFQAFEEDVLAVYESLS